MKLLPTVEIEIKNKIAQLDALQDSLSGVFIVHRMPDFVVEYMSPRGLEQLGTTLEEVRQLSAKEYYERYFNPEDADVYVPKMRGFMEQNKDDSISFFQQVKLADNPKWVWHLSVTKILLRDENGTPLFTITTALPVESMQHITTKVERLLEENNFLRENYNQFSKLTKRERDILKLQVLGNSSQEIGEQLFISTATVETHRRNLKKKLDVNSSFELSEYARAFDLV